MTTFGALLILLPMLALAWWAWRPLLRLAETNFWTLNAVLVQPAYLASREIARTAFAPRSRTGRLAKLAAGAAIALPPLAIAWLAWPSTRWIGAPSDLIRPEGLMAAAFANALVVMMGYARPARARSGPSATRRRRAPSISIRRSRCQARASGASRISPTCTRSASATDSGSRAGDRARAATNAWRRPSPRWPPSTPASRWTSS